MKMLIKFKGRELSRILCLINFVPRKYSGARCAANLHFYTLNSHIDILSDFPSISPSIFISFLKSRCKQKGNINLIKQIQFAEERTQLSTAQTSLQPRMLPNRKSTGSFNLDGRNFQISSHSVCNFSLERWEMIHCSVTKAFGIFATFSGLLLRPDLEILDDWFSPLHTFVR